MSKSCDKAYECAAQYWVTVYEKKIVNLGDRVLNLDPEHIGSRVGALVDLDVNVFVVRVKDGRERWVRRWTYYLPKDLLTDPELEEPFAIRVLEMAQPQWQHHLNRTASAKPEVVQSVFGLPGVVDGNLT